MEGARDREAIRGGLQSMLCELIGGGGWDGRRKKRMQEEGMEGGRE